MEKVKVLFIFEEITPYLPESYISQIGRNLPQGIQENGKEIRTFMPKYGCVNERRNQLHEVIRLSGMNLIINDTDHPLIIKVASIQSARMQIYFIDNEDYFGRKNTFSDGEGKEFSDNDERTIFFSRGVIETIIKLNWSPDIIHCHGWFSSLVPLYIKKSYSDHPLFADSKVVYSAYNDDFKNPLNKKFKDKLLFEGINKKDVSVVNTPDFININKLAVDYSDGIIIGHDDVNKEIKQYAEDSKKPVIKKTILEDDQYIKDYSSFYDNILKP